MAARGSKPLPGYKQKVAEVLKVQILSLNSDIDAGKVYPQHQIKRFVWKTMVHIHNAIEPAHPEEGSLRKEAWCHAKGMLKSLVDWGPKFRSDFFNEEAFFNTIEVQVLKTLKRYEHYVLTNSVENKHPEPKILGQTDNILCVDKPSKYHCSYGDHNGCAPPLQNARCCSELLNSEQENIQIHEYLALKFNHETAAKTREFWEWQKQQWKWKAEWHPCRQVCGKCEWCCYSQTGCCHRLDEETSGVLVTAKTFECFKHVRDQFESKTEKVNANRELKKFYIALCQGHIREACGETHCIAYDCVWDDEKNRMRRPVPQDGEPCEQDSWTNDAEKSWDQKGWRHTRCGDVQSAVTYYEPLAWYEHDRQQFTLVRVQIITGRRHQIRFHMSEIGYPLVGDIRYGGDLKIRNWAKRIFLHSYLLRFTEPSAQHPYLVTSPLPEDLGLLLEDLKCLKGPQPTGGSLLSRRQHKKLEPIFRQYDTTKPLMVLDMTHQNIAGKCLRDAWAVPSPAKRARLEKVA
eukprot:gnl/MRDRNA2_/MRDRNA2_93000_c0_seq1.p1 gnl/MRDRNA2_/MRDRNA2_93000_c0~~gnl/MRDRNA2_/MRDRNA2_93000_c0_seq1.p1  ORF type:complete len:517 (-),score=85.67 gnl/MRDRNA2_/MRDRNA2_93000_c0_seq1:204-1754(-)